MNKNDKCKKMLVLLIIILHLWFMEEIKTVKEARDRLDLVLGKKWRNRCSFETGVPYPTVINVLRGRSHEKKVKVWLFNEVENTKHMFI